MEVIYRKLSDMKKLDGNPRKITQEQLETLKQSIERNKDYFEARPLILSNRTGELVVIAGNQRYEACKQLGIEECPTVLLEGLTEEREKEIIIRDNVSNGEWEEELLQEWNPEDLEDWGVAVSELDLLSDEKFKEGDSNSSPNPKLSDKFIVPPFSVLNARAGEWVKRKSIWNNIIGDACQTRESLLFNMPQIKYPKLYERYLRNRESYMCSFSEFLDKHVTTEEFKKEENKRTASNTSLLDPVLSEIICNWFGFKNCNTFDCFAGDTVFGYVSSYLGNNFIGIELRQEQADMNNHLTEGMSAKYICDDGRNVLNHIGLESQDLLFSCPPYFDLEIYSDLENDASNQREYKDYLNILDDAFSSSIKCLKYNRFAVIVIGDVRDKRRGFYYNIPNDIKRIFEKSGMSLYNELILIDSCVNAGIRASRYMEHRKVVKVHQNVLVFYKGDAKKIKELYPKIEYGSEDLERFEMDLKGES